MLSWFPRPRPVPISPPLAMAKAALIGWYPVAVGSLHGLSQMVTRSLHVGELAPREVGGGAEQRGADHEVGGARGRHPQHHDEQGEEHQRRAEVVLRHHDHHGHAPGHEHGAEVLGLGQVERTEAERAHGQQLALVDQVGREEDRQHDLGDLAGLEADRPHVDPDLRAVDLATDVGDERQDEQPDADEGERVAVASQRTQPPHDDQGAHERGRRPPRSTPPGDRPGARAGADTADRAWW